jgi:hypothetical protein
VRAVDPDLNRAHLLVTVYADDGRFDQALAEEERGRPLIPAPAHWATLAYVDGRAGRTREARHDIQEMVRSSGHDSVQARLFTWAYAGVKDKKQTLTWLEKAFAERSSEMVTLEVNPAYDFLRGDPRFQRLLERAGLAP